MGFLTSKSRRRRRNCLDVGRQTEGPSASAKGRNTLIPVTLHFGCFQKRRTACSDAPPERGGRKRIQSEEKLGDGQGEVGKVSGGPGKGGAPFSAAS